MDNAPVGITSILVCEGALPRHDATLTEGFGDGLNRRIKVAFLFL